MAHTNVGVTVIDTAAVIGEMRMTIEEIIAVDIADRQLPDPKHCEPLEDEAAAFLRNLPIKAVAWA
jgi:hypothetical protein